MMFGCQLRLYGWAAVSLQLISTAAALEFLNTDFDTIESEKPYKIQWTGNTGPVTITLVDVISASNLRDISTIVAHASGSSYTWTPPRDLLENTYTFRLSDESSGKNVYSAPWDYAGFAGNGGRNGGNGSGQQSLSIVPPVPSESFASAIASSTPPVSESVGGAPTTTGSAPNTLSPAGDATATDSQSSSASPTGSTLSSSSDQGLSTGAKAGIGIGAGLGGLIVLVVLAWVFYRKGKQSGTKTQAPDTATVAELGTSDPKPMPEMAGNSIAEMSGNNFSELNPQKDLGGVSPAVHEIPAEMATDWRGHGAGDIAELDGSGRSR